MSMLNSMFYNVADRIINPDNKDNLKDTLNNLVRGSFGFGKDITPDDDMADDGSLIGDGSDVLSEIRDNDAKYNDNLMSLFPTEFDEFSEANTEANGSLLDGMRMSTFKVEIINAELDIVDPMQLAFREMFLGLREDNLMFQHENSQWFEKIVQGLDRLDRSGERNAIGIVLAYKQFMRHPVWYTLSAVANLVVDLGKMVASSGFKLLFGFGKKKTVDEQILEETKRQTEFMLTGEINQTKNLWQQFKSGGVAGLIGRSIGDVLGITQSEAQKRADARLQGEEVAGGIAGFLSDKIFGREIVRRENDKQLQGTALREQMVEYLKSVSTNIQTHFQKSQEISLPQLVSLKSVAVNTEQMVNEQQTVYKQVANGGSIVTSINRAKTETTDNLNHVGDSINETNSNIVYMSRQSKKFNRSAEAANDEIAERLEEIQGNTKDTAKESKKTNRHLLMSKMMSILSSVGSFFKGFGGVGGLLKKGLGASMIAFALKSGMDKLKSGDGMGIGSMIGTTVGGLLVGGVKGALLGGAFSVGTVIGTWANDNLVNPAVEWLTGEEGQTLGGAIYDFFNGMKDKMMTMTTEELDVEKKKREEANFIQKKLGIGVMTESEIAEVEERLRGEERLLAGARRKKEAREAAENSSYKNVGEVDAVLADVDAKIAGLAQAIPALSAQGQHQIAARYGQELGALEAQKSELTKVKSGLELMGGSKEKSLTEQAKDVAAKSGAAVASGAQSITNYVYDASVGAWKNTKDGAYYIKDKATGAFNKMQQQPTPQATPTPTSSGGLSRGDQAALDDAYSRTQGVAAQSNRPSINTAEARKDVNARMAETSNAVMVKKLDRMIESIDKQTSALDAAMGQIPGFDPYPDNKTILNASGGMF